MLIKQTRTDNHVLELHHLGRLNLSMQVENPNPQKLIPDYDYELMFGSIFEDAYFWKRAEEDFYYTYERVQGNGSVTEEVSFTKPIEILSDLFNGNVFFPIFKGLVPRQHSAVTDYKYDSELAGFEIPAGSADFYGWEYRKVTHKHSVNRCVEGLYDSLIPEYIMSRTAEFVPSELFNPLYKDAPRYVLDVLDMFNFGLFDAVPPGYIKHFKPRLSQKLLEAPRSLV